MGWASQYIERLQNNEVIELRPVGNSMTPLIESRQLVTVAPLRGTVPSVGDVVLCKVNGQQYLHLVKAVRGNQFQIGNNHGKVNGWVTINSIYGRALGLT